MRIIPLGRFGRGFQFSFLGILILEILFPEIVFLNMCILKRLVDGLNFQEKFVHFQKYPWQSSIQRRSMVVRQRSTVAWWWLAAAGGEMAAADGGPTAVDGGSVVVGGGLAAVGGG